jgi:phosphatidylglycerol:prolipoprotein diacylglycerol transferase
MILGLGAALGLFRISRQRSGQWLDAALLALLFCLFGARLGYAVERLDYFSAHPAEVLAVYQGGLSGGGAVFGWLFGLLVAAGVHKEPVLRLADWLYPLIPPLVIAGYLALWQAGAVYGPALSAGSWGGIPTADESGQIAQRWPIQLIAALALLVFYWLLEVLITVPRPAGWLSSLAAAWFLAVNLVISLLRADPVPTVKGLSLRVDILENLIFLALFLGLFSFLTFIDRKKPSVGKLA